MPRKPAPPSAPSAGVEPPILTLIGERVALGPIRRDLIPLYQRWINDFEVTHTLGVTRVFSREAEEAWYESAAKSPTTHGFTIYLRDGLQPIGNCDLHAIDPLNRVAEFGIMIGEKRHWNNGYGTEAAALTLDYGFQVLDLHNIFLRVFDNNARGLRSYEKAGFKFVGRLREARRIGGRAVDVVYMDCLRREYRSAALAKIMKPHSRGGR